MQITKEQIDTYKSTKKILYIIHEKIGKLIDDYHSKYIDKWIKYITENTAMDIWDYQFFYDGFHCEERYMNSIYISDEYVTFVFDSYYSRDSDKDSHSTEILISINELVSISNNTELLERYVHSYFETKYTTYSQDKIHEFKKCQLKKTERLENLEYQQWLELNKKYGSKL